MFKGGSTREQLEIIIAKRGTPTDSDLRHVSRGALEMIRRMPTTAPVPWNELFPTATPLAADLLSKMLTFDQHTRISVDEALAHPYLKELHSCAREPVAEAPFDWRYEVDYPDAMPQVLLQVRRGAWWLGVPMAAECVPLLLFDWRFSSDSASRARCVAVVCHLPRVSPFPRPRPLFPPLPANPWLSEAHVR